MVVLTGFHCIREQYKKSKKAIIAEQEWMILTLKNIHRQHMNIFNKNRAFDPALHVSWNRVSMWLAANQKQPINKGNFLSLIEDFWPERGLTVNRQESYPMSGA